MPLKMPDQKSTHQLKKKMIMTLILLVAKPAKETFQRIKNSKR